MVANDLGDRVTPAVVAFTDHEIVSCRCYVLVGVRAGVIFLLASGQVLCSSWGQGRCYVLVGIMAGVIFLLASGQVLCSCWDQGQWKCGDF